MEDYWGDRRDGWKNKTEDARDPWETDYGRIIHSSSFRRLQGKTQILNLGDSDFYRTRLTHSLEVGQIAKGLTQQLRKNYDNDSKIITALPNPTMIQAIGFTHDLGHPPFGHGGEVALNYCMRDHGGFEGNGQTLRILSKLERFSDGFGSNLTRRALLGILKYPVKYSNAKNPKITPNLKTGTSFKKFLNDETCKPPKCYHDEEEDVVGWTIEQFTVEDQKKFSNFKEREGRHNKPIYKSFDCSIMDLADDIAYGVHDLEDMITMKLISREDFEKLVTPKQCRSFLDHYTAHYKDEVGNDSYKWFVDGLFGDANQKKRFISRLVGHFITNVQAVQRNEFSHDLLDYKVKVSDECMDFLNALKNVVVKKVIKSPQVQHLEFKGQQMVVSVFEAYANDPDRFMPEYTKEDFEKGGRKIRLICDHVAGMTDAYLLRTYDRLFSPRMGSTFDRL